MKPKGHVLIEKSTDASSSLWQLSEKHIQHLLILILFCYNTNIVKNVVKEVYLLLLQSSNFYISNRQNEDIHTWIAEKQCSSSLFKKIS